MTSCFIAVVIVVLLSLALSIPVDSRSTNSKGRSSNTPSSSSSSSSSLSTRKKKTLLYRNGRRNNSKYNDDTYDDDTYDNSQYSKNRRSGNDTSSFIESIVSKNIRNRKQKMIIIPKSKKRNNSNSNNNNNSRDRKRKTKPLVLKAFDSIKNAKKIINRSATYALTSTSKIKRNIKGYFSSDFEILLLRLTKPDEYRPSMHDIDSFITTIETFVRNMDTTSSSNPYRVTLRKIWNKISESDGRTVIKALLLLHTLLRYAQPEDALIFKTLLTKMMKENSKKTNTKYFDVGRTFLVSPDSHHLQDFIARYSTYVLKRSKTFTSTYEEMKLIGHGMIVDDICAQMMKAYKLIDYALQCKLENTDEECEIVLACLEIVALDVRDLFLLYSEKLQWIVKEEQVGDLFSQWKEIEVKALLKHLKLFYDDRFDDVSKFLNEISEILSLYRIKINISLGTKANILINGNKSTIASTAITTSVGANRSNDDDSFDADTVKKPNTLDSDMGVNTDIADILTSNIGGSSSSTYRKANKEVKDIFKDDDQAKNWQYDLPASDTTSTTSDDK